MEHAVFAPDLATIHAGYLDTLAHAQGQPLPPAALLRAADSVALFGNAYQVARVSLVLQVDGAIKVYSGTFDPHALAELLPRAPVDEEHEVAGAALMRDSMALGTVTALPHFAAPLDVAAPACAGCHGARPGALAALLYHLREIADD